MKFILTHLLFFISLHLSAQTCNTEMLLQTPGNWRPSPQGSASGLSAADLAREKKIAATLHSMIQSKYSPMGLQASFLGSYGREYANMPGNYYGYSIAPYTFYCDGNMVKTKIDTYNDFFINANLFEDEIYDTTNENTGTGEGYYSMSNLPEYKDGAWLFKEIDQNLGMQITGKKSSWLITYNNQLPFSYVTKKEFLEKRKRILTAQKRSMEEVFVINLKNIEIEKKYKEEEFKNDPVNLEKYMRMVYSDSNKIVQKTIGK